MGERKGPCIYITNCPRTMSRAGWKWLYRMQRVILRETEKVNLDVILYGSGYMKCEPGEDPQHVPLEDWVDAQQS